VGPGVIRTHSVVVLAAVIAVVGALGLSDVPLFTSRTLIDGCVDPIAFKSADACVTGLQIELVRRDGAELEADGQFGAGTLAAVKAYQQRRGLLADGIVGDSTKQRLRLDRPRLTCRSAH
jgi:peptidoglycan hydrolase-like protein with peptidoglycan-binding domain